MKKILLRTLFSGALIGALLLTGQSFAAPKKAEKPAPTGKLDGVVQAKIGPGLQAKLNSLVNPNASAGAVLISFRTSSGLSGVPGLSTILASHGVSAGSSFQALGIVGAVLTKAQVLALQNEPLVRSLWDNYQLYYNLHQARILCGVDKLRADAGLTSANGNHVVDGSATGNTVPNPSASQPNKPVFSVLLIDSGVDTTGAPTATVGNDPTTGLPYEADLKYDNSSVGVLSPGFPPTSYAVPPTIPNTKIIQNLQAVGDEAAATLHYAENQVNDDSVGHGSHCAGIIGSLGTFSRHTPAVSGPNASTTGPGIGTTEDFSGVANGAKIIGYGSGAGLFVLDALGGFDYAINFQTFYNIRITSNSYGSVGPYDPDDPLNIAIQTAYNANIISVFAAGNSGPGVDTISNSSKSPYVIDVAAGTKEGGLASFSSRGKPIAERTPGSPDEYNFITVTAPGTGREFDFDAPGGTSGKGFYSDIISTESKLVGAAHGTNDQEFPAPYQAVYTQISGTSMACPFIAGTCALLLDANPNLTFAQIKSILQSTATVMPGFADYEVGSGYVNVFAAVDEAFYRASHGNASKGYSTFALRDPQDFNTAVTRNPLDPPGRPIEDDHVTPYPPPTVMTGPNHDEDFSLPYSTTSVNANDYEGAKTKAKTNDNAYAFQVNPGTSIIDFRIQFGNDSAAGFIGGNTIGVLLYSPDGSQYSSGIALPLLDAANRQVVVKDPAPGVWVAELRGIRGLAAVPITPPTGVGIPDTTTGQIFRTNLSISEPNDIAEVAQASAIRAALANRYLDTFLDPQHSGQTSFTPTAKVTRGDFLKALVLNVPLRQTLASDSQRFTDVDATTSRWAEAATQSGSSLRDFDFTPGPLIKVSASPNFEPQTVLSRSQIAVALVRALGLDKEAQALKTIAQVTYTYNGTAYPVQDITPYNSSEPDANTENGYLQLAIDRGLLPIVPQVRPGNVTVYAYPGRPMVRADLATAINNFRHVFSQGNSLAANETPASGTSRAAR